MNLTIENVELWIAALGAIVGLGVWGYKSGSPSKKAESRLMKSLMQLKRLLTELKK